MKKLIGLLAMVLIGTMIPSMSVAAANESVEIDVVLQGASRPADGWVIPLTVQFFTPNSDVLRGVPVLISTQNTAYNDLMGIALVNVSVPDGTYDVTVKSNHTLLNVKRGVVISGLAVINMGTLLEGNAYEPSSPNSWIINLSDFTWLSGSYGKSVGQAGYRVNADFDRNGIVNNADFQLLLANYQKASPITVP